MEALQRECITSGSLSGMGRRSLLLPGERGGTDEFQQVRPSKDGDAEIVARGSRLFVLNCPARKPLSFSSRLFGGTRSSTTVTALFSILSFRRAVS